MFKNNILNKAIALTGAIIITATTAFYTGTTYAENDRLNMSYIYFGNSSLYSTQVEKTQNSLQVVSPNYFNIDEYGGLKLTDSVDEGFIKEMHNQNIKVIPFLSNHWNRELGRLALENKEDLVDDIYKMIKKYNLDGINIDLENLNEKDRDHYTEFVKLIREKLSSDKVVSVSVAPNPYGIDKGWQGSYDYELLSKHSDYLVLMAYDESYTGGPEGPVASVDFVEKSIKNILKEVPKEKILLGMPFYGRIWDEKGDIQGYGLSIKKINEILNEHDNEIIYDGEKQAVKAIIEIKSNENKVYLAGKNLEPGKYIIWYENDKSIKSKLRLVQKYDLKGTASWSLGQENEGIWSYYELWLNGQYFHDIDNHWAEEAILDMERRDWMKGSSVISFSPNVSLTRAQGAAILVRALNLKEKKDFSLDFSDVSNAHWAKEEIDIASQYGIIKGYNNGSFQPEKAITREEMAVMLHRILSQYLKSEEIKLNYKDIKYNRWSYEAISKMSYAGIFTGFEDNTFRPDQNITRGQMAALMDRVASYIE